MHVGKWRVRKKAAVQDTWYKPDWTSAAVSKPGSGGGASMQPSRGVSASAKEIAEMRDKVERYEQEQKEAAEKEEEEEEEAEDFVGVQSGGEGEVQRLR